MGLRQSVQLPGGCTNGYRVLKIQTGSPGDIAGLEAYFDFLIAINDVPLTDDTGKLRHLLTSNIDKVVNLRVFNIKTCAWRNVTCVLTKGSWQGEGLLGISIRYCAFYTAIEHVWHVLDVQPGSPAASAGLISEQDYVVGIGEMISDDDDIHSAVFAFDGQPLNLHVYNLATDSCRQVTVTPNSNWGGLGTLGCGIGYGYLHRIPLRRLSPSGDQNLVNSSNSTKSDGQYNGDAGDHHSSALQFNSPPPYDSLMLVKQHSTVVGSNLDDGSLQYLPAMTTPLSVPGLPPLDVSVPAFGIKMSNGDQQHQMSTGVATDSPLTQHQVPYVSGMVTHT